MDALSRPVGVGGRDIGPRFLFDGMMYLNSCDANIWTFVCKGGEKSSVSVAIAIERITTVLLVTSVARNNERTTAMHMEDCPLFHADMPALSGL